MSNRGGGGSGMSSIPPASRKMVQSLKEIVNCPEPEIYAMLKECNMDPNEAVNLLLSQDPFHEVRSKREKKKENKDTPEPRVRGASNPSNRGNRSGADRYGGRSGSTHVSLSESASIPSKPVYRKENGPQSDASFSYSASGVAVNSNHRKPVSNSEAVAAESKTLSVGLGDTIPSVSQPGFKSAWSGVSGQVSMAEIVKMGKPHGKISETTHQSQSGVLAPPLTAASYHDVHQPSKMSETNRVLEAPKSQYVNSGDEWPSVEQLSITVSSVLELPAEPESNLDTKSNLPVRERDYDETVTSRHRQEEPSVGMSDNMYQNMSSYQAHGHDENEAEDGATSVATNLQQLSLQEDDKGEPPEKDDPPVMIPDHLQVHAPECAQLSFGSFRSGNSAATGSCAQNPSKDMLEGTSLGLGAASVGHTDTRTTEYYGDENVRATLADDVIPASGSSAQEYEASESEVLKQETSEPVHGNQYGLSSSTPGYSYEDSQRLNDAVSEPQTNSQLHSLPTFSTMMQAYTSSLPSALLPSAVQAVREPDLTYSPFPVTQSMPVRHNSATSSIGGATISMAEALRAGGIPTQQALSGANAPAGPALPQQLAMHPYSQPTLPLSHFANMIGYPFLPQSYTYMPSAFQQGFGGSSSYNQSLAALLPQYKNSGSVSSLAQSAAVASGYGFGTSATVPGQNFQLNPPSAPVGTSIGFGDVLSSQFKDSNHVMSLQQTENPAMWVQGPGTRTMPAVPTNSYHNFPGQNQQAGGLRQAQQPSQHFGALGYTNMYHSQGGLSLESQQNPRDGSLVGSQAQSIKHPHQMWQNSSF